MGLTITPPVTSVTSNTGGLTASPTTGAVVLSTGYIVGTSSIAITAAGTDQAGATAITTSVCNVTTVAAANAGVRLPSASAGVVIIIRNSGANTLSVYPASTNTINTGAANVAFSLPVGAVACFVCMSSTAWYTLNATYA